MILSATSVEAGMAPQRFETAGGALVIGRGADCDWVLPDPSRALSKRHCRMHREDGRWRVTDLSSNGMTLNDRPLTPGLSQPVEHGDRLGMGSYEIALSLDAGRDDVTMLDLGPPQRVEPTPFGGDRQGGRLLGDPFSAPGDDPITDPFDVALPPLFEERPAPRPAPRGSAGDDVSELRAPFEPPRPGSQLLPEDWDAPLNGPAPAPRPSPFDPPPPPIPASFDPAAPDSLFPEPPQVCAPPGPPGPDAPSAPANAGVLPVEGQKAAEALPGFPPLDPMADTARTLPRQAPAAGAAGRAPPPPQAAASGDAASDADAMRRAFAAFARGAGLDGAPQDGAEVALEKLGRAFRAYVVGLRRLLIARATVKGEFRIDRTVIRPFGNNPLKFATDDNDALSALLGIGRQVAMTPEQAVSDSIRDVRSHEVALTRAFGEGIRQLVAELSPERVGASLPPGPFDAIPLVRDARRWRAFLAAHAALAGSVDNNLDGAFGQAFARAYEAALAEPDENAPPSDAAAGRVP